MPDKKTKSTQRKQSATKKAKTNGSLSKADIEARWKAHQLLGLPEDEFLWPIPGRDEPDQSNCRHQCQAHDCNEMIAVPGGFCDKHQPDVDRLMAGSKSLMDHAKAEIDHSKTLLGNRYLCRAGGALWIGSSGQGKSSSLTQATALWGCGREAFGIKPAKPLRIVILQSENDDGDVTEATCDLPAELKLTDEECKMVEQNTLMLDRSNPELIGANAYELVARLELILKAFNADLLIIDNYCSYFQGTIPLDDSQAFLSRTLNPMLERCDVGVIIAHHTPKTNYRNTDGWDESDWQYAGSGVAGMTNWARAVMVIETVSYPVFAFRAAKRGNKAGWEDEFGDSQRIRHFQHHPKKTIWIPSDEDEVGNAETRRDEQKQKQRGSSKKPVPTNDDVLKFVLPGMRVHKQDLLERLELDFGASQRGARIGVQKALRDEKVFEHKVQGRGQAKIYISRSAPIINGDGGLAS